MAERREDAAYFDTLLALLPDGELTETELENLDRYLAEDPEAGLLRDDLAALEDSALWEEPLPEGLHGQIMASVARTPQTAAKKKHTARRWGGIAAMLAVVILVGSIGLSHMRMGSPMSSMDSAAPEAAMDTAGVSDYDAADRDIDGFFYADDEAEAPASTEAEENASVTAGGAVAPAPEPVESLTQDGGAPEEAPTLTLTEKEWLDRAADERMTAEEKGLSRERDRSSAPVEVSGTGCHAGISSPCMKPSRAGEQTSAPTTVLR